MKGGGQWLNNGGEEKHRGVEDQVRKFVLLEEKSWRQRSRAIWLKKGDGNTKRTFGTLNRNYVTNITRNSRCCKGITIHIHKFDFKISNCLPILD